MKFKKMFSEKTWLKSGVIGIVICATLFLFYIFVYFPIIDRIYADDIAKYGGTPNWTLSIPFYTGHFFPFFSSFMLEGFGLGNAGFDVVAGVLSAILLFLIYFFVGAIVGIIIQKVRAK